MQDKIFQIWHNQFKFVPSTTPGHFKESDSVGVNLKYINGASGATLGKNWYHKRRQGNACVYILDTARVLEDCTVTWRQQEIDLKAPDDTMLYSLCAGRGELIMFGGMRSDVQGDNPHPFTHIINNDIYILSPARLV
uniref:Uncharacterized protein n=1 Tax=Brugia malayi TaxID=6279 RepID=A8QHF7_BRUMA